MKKNFNCKNFGIYAAKYINNLKSTITDDFNERAALKLHYAKKDKTSKKGLKETFSIIFVDTTRNYSDLNFFKS